MYLIWIPGRLIEEIAILEPISDYLVYYWKEWYLLIRDNVRAATVRRAHNWNSENMEFVENLKNYLWKQLDPSVPHFDEV